MVQPEPAHTPDLASRLAAGDPTAFEQLFEAYADRLVRYIDRYIRSREQAQDLVQDLFLRLWDRHAELGTVGDFDAYLYRAARNRALTYLRQRGVEERWRGREEQAHTPELDSTAADPTDRIIAERTTAALQRAIDALAPRQREVILRYWRGDASVAIAAALGISPKTVGVHVSRAIDNLRKALRDFLR